MRRSNMRIYTVHPPPSFADPDDEPLLVKEGFCWPAMYFTVLWAVWHRMWVAAAILFAAGAAIGFAVDALGLDPLSRIAVTLGFGVLVGFHANDWRRRALARRDYEEAGVVAAPRAEAALRRFIDLQSVEGRARTPASLADVGPLSKARP